MAATKQTVRKRTSRPHSADDWERGYVENFLEKYCSDRTVEAEHDDEGRLEDERLSLMTERERIIAEELNAKLEVEMPSNPAPATPTARRPAASALAVTLAYVAIVLALASSAFVIVGR